MPNEQSDFLAVSIANKIYVIGDEEGKMVDRFDLEEDKWINLLSMNLPKFGISACLVTELTWKNLCTHVLKKSHNVCDYLVTSV